MAESQNLKHYDLEDRTLKFAKDVRDFVHRAKICRKEAKESRYWLKLVYIENNDELEKERAMLIQESTELMNIFGAIIHKSV